MKKALIAVLATAMVTHAYAANRVAKSSTSGSSCELQCNKGVCLDSESQQSLSTEEVTALLAILNQHEDATIPFAARSIKTVIAREVYLLFGHTRDYYGVELVISKETSGWTVLKKIDRVY